MINSLKRMCCFAQSLFQSTTVISSVQEMAGVSWAEGAQALYAYGCLTCSLLHVPLLTLSLAQHDLGSNDPDAQSSQDLQHHV